VNASEKATYTFGHVIRAGIEGAYKTFRIRGGYSFSTTPYKKNQYTKGYAEERHNATFGLGYRGRKFYVDGAYVFGIMKDASQPYADFALKSTNITHTVFLTFGWRINKDQVRAQSETTPPPSDF
jgi:hypothetical protein